MKTINHRFLIVSLIILLLALIFIAMNTGTIKVSLSELYQGLFVEYNEKVASIYHIRFPRIVISLLCGSALAISGVIFQAVLKNPLADPGMIGISSGCSLGALLCMIIFPQFFYLKPFAAFLGGMLAFFLIYSLSWQSGFSPLKIILIGVALHYMLNGIIDVLSSNGLNNASVNALVNSNISLKTWNDINQVGIYIPPLLIIAFFTHKTCDLLALEDRTLISLGVNVKVKRFVLSFIAVLLVSLSVSLAGVISFVGLIVPHLVRVLVGTKHKYLMLLSGLMGSIILLLSDTLGRMIMSPYEISASVIMAIVGAPIFILLLKRSKL